jgi:HD-GYP domain-containing protein (c-di-GMP phosphodiesterase class II)
MDSQLSPAGPKRVARTWIQRWSTERGVAVALRLLRGVEGPGDLTRGRRAELLSELAAELESRDPYTHGHSRRVARHAVVIALRMGLPENQVATIRAAAALHDVGKINTPRAVLHKPGRLTDVELALIELHPVDGAQIVSTLGDPELTAMVRHHHERLDGTGYPDGLSGAEIPLGARIIAVADTFDAITSTRPYRPARTHDAAMEILAAEAGSRLDLEGVRALQAYYAEGWMRPLWTPRRGVISGSIGLASNSRRAVG